MPPASCCVPSGYSQARAGQSGIRPGQQQFGQRVDRSGHDHGIVVQEHQEPAAREPGGIVAGPQEAEIFLPRHKDQVVHRLQFADARVARGIVNDDELDRQPRRRLADRSQAPERVIDLAEARDDDRNNRIVGRRQQDLRGGRDSGRGVREAGHHPHRCRRGREPLPVLAPQSQLGQDLPGQGPVNRQGGSSHEPGGARKFLPRAAQRGADAPPGARQDCIDLGRRSCVPFSHTPQLFGETLDLAVALSQLGLRRGLGFAQRTELLGPQVRTDSFLFRPEFGQRPLLFRQRPSGLVPQPRQRRRGVDRLVDRGRIAVDARSRLLDRRIAGDRDQVERPRQAGHRLQHVGRAAIVAAPSAAGGGIRGSHHRAEQRPLLQDPVMSEKAVQQRGELRAGQFQNVKPVHRLARRRINLAVRRADDQHAAAPQNAADLGEKRKLVAQMLQRLKTDHHIERRIGQRQGGRVGLHELKIGSGVGGARMCDRGGVDLDAHRPAGDACQQRRAIALTGCDIEHVLAGAQVAGEAIAVKMLEGDLTADIAGHALAGERQREGRARHGEIAVSSARTIARWSISPACPRASLSI